MHQLKGLYGVAYSCSNPNITYCDDWYTENYKEIFDNKVKNRSLYNVKNLGFNLIRTYYLDPYKDHSYFLNLCDKLELSVEIGISNNLLESKDINSIQKLINNVKNYKCVKIYTIGNEYFGNLDNIIYCLNIIYSLDPNKYFMHSSIFDNNFKSALDIYNKIPQYILSKYIVGINMYFYNNLSNSHGNIMQKVIEQFYNSPLQNTYLIISEYGYNKINDQWDALWNFSWGNLEAIKQFPKYLGYSLFSLSDEKWKGENNGECNYGIISENDIPKSGYYAIREIKKTSQFQEIIKTKL